MRHGDEGDEEIREEESKLKYKGDKRREGGESDDIIKPTLFIVESPTKAKTIARFFGKPGIKIFNGSIVYEIPTERHILLILFFLFAILSMMSSSL